MIHNHQTHTYPADKPIPKQVLNPVPLKKEDEIYATGWDRRHSPAQRKIMKKQHNRRARQFRKKIELED